MEALKSETFESARGLQKLEASACALQKALQFKLDDAYQQMSAVSERVALFTRHVEAFSDRLLDHIRSLLSHPPTDDVHSTSSKGLRLHSSATLQQLVQYRTLIEWLKEMDARKYSNLQLASNLLYVITYVHS